MAARSSTHLFALLIAYVIGYALWLLLGASAGAWSSQLANLLLIPPFLLATRVVWTVARLPQVTAARAWRWLGHGLLAWALGGLMYSGYELLGLSPFPSLADLGYLAALPCFAAGLMALRRERRGTLQTLSFLIDVSLATLILGALGWQIFFRATLADTAQPILALWISLAYPVLYLLLCAATVTLALWRPLDLQRRVVSLLAAGLLCFLGTDVLYFQAVARGTYVGGTWLDLGWPLAALLIAWAAYRSGEAATRPQPSWPQLPGEWWKRLLPHYAVLAAFLVYLGLQLGIPLDRPQQVLLWLIMGLFALRQLLVLTDNQRLQRQLTHRAEHDPLTGVRNRSDLEDNLQQQIDQARRWNSVVAVMFMDLDRMKEINDTFGHVVGDLLLQKLATRLSDALPADAVLFRFGGDEFVVVLPGHDAPAAARVAQTLLDAAGKAFQIGPETLHVSASLGVALAPGDATHATAAIEHADGAMYHAKQAGRGTWRFANERLNGLHMPQAQLEVQLRGALERGEFAMHFQPLIELSSGRVRSFEALMRWTSPVLGPVSPADFIAVAETREMMGGLGQWALRESIRQMCAWQAALPGVSVAVNVSATQFAHEHFVAETRAALAEYGGAPGLLTLEVTESAVLVDAAQARQKLLDLRALGVRVALDDFGTGYSSLGQLRSLPVDVLKIDRVFIQDSHTDAAFIQAMISMGHSLGLEVVAEGIEDAATVARLQALHCDLGQGFYFARPQSAGQAVAAMTLNGPPSSLQLS
ncbi:putative bifunctional diguanylate cyclase/phosphodiesterase [Deinococcus radiopugnans]|uniref:Diguanylate cyclase (GGDEF)-like protein n=1 Tax=Deinococcus radiopugnans ATCC 19172 TaxID=585398 RepID=A0A5C4XM70_9DEIO|nr:EAL domain-containing protein [Deinococcus radiopugnans]MBB6018723.1 diguanylate cyclase (GGDEF)-like protein [Deinococcus radiopugnans ATCC 19172]TNM64397.1 EAL domain-containing protein [Deinococcus radiopugnans ATCC 19172]